MSGFAVIFERSNQPIDPQLLERVMQRLNHRGPDGRDVLQVGSVVMGHWHFWTTPEEVGERQPLALPGLPFTLVFDGRLDNRPELLAELRIDPAEGLSLSDAALTLRAYARWRQDCFAYFVGEFAVVLYDQQRGELLCARDQLGDRTLFYTIQATRVVIASEPWAAALESEMNTRTVAESFVFGCPAATHSFFKDVDELQPAHVMTFSDSTQQVHRYWQPDFSKKLRGHTDDEYAAEFRSLLEQSVTCRMRSTTPVGVLMSGGLDSTSVACFAAQQIAPKPLTTLSYVFDELIDCDERQYINAMQEKWGLNSIQIPCDDAWPFKNWQAWPSNPNMPESNPYRLLKERAYKRAQTEGLRVLLTGGFGDQLYSAGTDWLADLLAEGQIKKAASEFLYYIRRAGYGWTLRAGYLQRAVRRFLDRFPGGNCIHRHSTFPDWLTDFGTKQLFGEEQKPEQSLGPYENMLGTGSAISSSAEIFNANRHSVELRHPYRDRRLVEFVLALPAHQLLNHGRYKHVLRNAMHGLLPESIRARENPTSLATLFFRGIEREKNLLETSLQVPGANWADFVPPRHLLEQWLAFANPIAEKPKSKLIWHCLSFEAWTTGFYQ